MPATRLQLRIQGAVQGVGFRPFVHALAARHHLAGHVLNDGDGVLVEVEGAGLDGFLAALRADAPPRARITAISVAPMPPRGERGFAIHTSTARPGAAWPVPDTATCDACLHDLFDPASRFFHYPFVTCADCGPRDSLTAALPFDRARTAMAAFVRCPDCARDDDDPANRRFHAETISCPACGPRLDADIADIADRLAAGGLVALKGIGGYHLLCDAACVPAVARLRTAKRRPRKPLALMVRDLAGLDRIAVPDAAERALFASAAAPIVLVRRRDDAPLAPDVAGDLRRIGVMRATAPVHHLLFAALAGRVATLVATSFNTGGAPIAADTEEAAAFAGLADLVVGHDRAILARVDDSLAAVIAGAPVVLRRARGFTLAPIELAEDGPSVLATGAHLKNAICVTRGREAFLGPHVGDLDHPGTVAVHEATIARLRRVLGITPEIVACDLHPDYRSTHSAHALTDRPVAVQHHVAHVAAVAAEHRLTGPVLGVALDGHGIGEDGSARGGELLLRTGGVWRRIGHLAPLTLPPGDRSAREPWRAALAVLAARGEGTQAIARFPDRPAGCLLSLLAQGRGAPTTSAGRLFDAAAALLGLCPVQSFEGEAAMALEDQVRTPAILADGWRRDGHRLDLLPLFGALSGLSAGEGADLFHGTLIAALTDWIADAAAIHGVTQIALGGGCLVNRVLAEGLDAALSARGLAPCLARTVPSGDGGLALGQAVVARAASSVGT